MQESRRKCNINNIAKWSFFIIKKKFFNFKSNKKAFAFTLSKKHEMRDIIIKNAHDLSYISNILFYNNSTQFGLEIIYEIEDELMENSSWRCLFHIKNKKLGEFYKENHNHLMNNKMIYSTIPFKKFNGERLSSEDVILMFPGIGDEITSSALFSLLQNKHINVVCDYRLKKIIEHTHQGIYVYPTHRANPHSIKLSDAIKDTYHFCSLPNYNLAKFIDNFALDFIKNYNSIYSVYDLLSYYKEHSENNQMTFFQTDRKSPLPPLPAEKKKVGILWSSLSRKGERDMYSIPEKAVKTILDQGDAIFVNLQYRSNLTHDKMINPNIDKVNDIEGLCALVKELDLVIGPATATVRLAAMSGTPVIIYAAGLISRFYCDDRNMENLTPLTYYVLCDNVSDVEKATQEIIDIINGRKVIDFS